ncbi:hypothetical protein [Klebsiella michiganensis]|uniref:hypothetical protein n=1 Tax=Klebsiella michiganensis TaxID=1134687 RepID=UPI001CA583C7|nr:hypothetical protein [Klebsiella michiganensis]MBW5936184.1 hypothetical protein [Klebsiella michiganensis]
MHHPDTVPEAALARLSGLPIRSPAKRSASREKAAPMHHPGTVPEAALAHLSGLVLLKNPERTGQFPLVVVRMPCPGSDF